jgi:hypothetical protein
MDKKLYKVTTRGISKNRKGEIIDEWERERTFNVVAEDGMDAISKIALKKYELIDEVELIAYIDKE